MDPFTGHETKGSWPAEYQKVFLDRAMEFYEPFIADYNKLMNDLDVHALIGQYMGNMKGKLSDKDLSQFEKDVRSEFFPI